MRPFEDLPLRYRSAGRRHGRHSPRWDWRGPQALAIAAGVAVLVVVLAVLVFSGGGSTARRKPVTTTTTPYPPATPVAILPGPVAPVISRIPTTNRVMFFTIDDGFVRDPAAARFIVTHKIPVTAFILPGPIEQDAAYFEPFVQAGGSVQDHTVHHQLLNKLSAARQVREICGSLDLIQVTFGRRPWLFRPPGGAMNATTKTAVRQCGLEAIVTWQGTMNDGVLRLQHPGSLQSGDIILLHFRHDLRKNLEVLLRAAVAAGLTPAPLEQYLPPPLAPPAPPATTTTRRR